MEGIGSDARERRKAPALLSLVRFGGKGTAVRGMERGVLMVCHLHLCGGGWVLRDNNNSSSSH